MIIKNPAPRSNAAQLADYLLKEKKNERAELLELRGWNMPTLKGAFSLTEEIAHTQTQCKNPFYHVAFRAAPGEVLTPEQWRFCADTLENKLGLTGHHRALVMHTYQGEKHLHVVWDRIDEKTLKAVNLWRDHTQSTAIARQLEQALGLKRLPTPAHNRHRDQELAPPTMAEEQQARRKGQDLKAIRQNIREAWAHSDNGPSFKAALESHGLTLARGDRRDYVALDAEGSVYSIGKRTTGAAAREVRAKLADLDRDTIPTIEQARAEPTERLQPPDQAPERPEPAPDARAAWEQAASPTTAPERPQLTETHENAAPDDQGGFRVIDRETGLESGVSACAAKILDGVGHVAGGFFEGLANAFSATAAPREASKAPTARPAPSAREMLQRQAARKRALRNISASVQRGEALNAADLHALPPAELKRLRDGGDEALQRLVQRFDRERDERGRERER